MVSRVFKLLIVLLLMISCKKLDIKRQSKIVFDSVSFDGTRINANINVVEIADNILDKEFGVILQDVSNASIKKSYLFELEGEGDTSFVLNDLTIGKEYSVQFFTVDFSQDTTFEESQNVSSINALNNPSQDLWFESVNTSKLNNGDIKVSCKFIDSPSFTPTQVGVYAVLENTSSIIDFEQVELNGETEIEVVLDELELNSNYFIVVEAEFFIAESESKLKIKYSPFPEVNL